MRQDQYEITVTIDDTNFGVWDALDGGEVDSEETTYKPGGMAPAIALGGSINVGNVTVSRLYKLDRDHQTLSRLLAKVGKGAVTITKQPLDVDGHATNIARVVYTGKLKQVTQPGVDSQSSDAAIIELEVSTNGTVAVQ